MDKIAQIREMLNVLPEKDIKIANKLLDKRQFVELRELVDSDVYKCAKKKFQLELSSGEEPSSEYMEVETYYKSLKDLQDEVTEQAKAFESDLDDEEFFSPEDYDDY